MGQDEVVSVGVSAQCPSVICMSSHMYVCMWCICVLCVHVPVGKTFSALLLVVPGGVGRQQQPHFFWAAKFGMRYFPLAESYESACLVLDRHSSFMVVNCPSGL